MQDCESLFMICAILVNTHTHTDSFWQVILLAQPTVPRKLKLTIVDSSGLKSYFSWEVAFLAHGKWWSLLGHGKCGGNAKHLWGTYPRWASHTILRSISAMSLVFSVWKVEANPGVRQHPGAMAPMAAIQNGLGMEGLFPIGILAILTAVTQ